MCEEYDVFLQRMADYRNRLNYTQVQISDELGITQSQLSKMELGKTIYSFKMLQSLYEKKWDIDYFITGKKYNYVSSEISDMLDSCVNKKAALQLVAWAFEQELQKNGDIEAADVAFEVKLLKQRAHQTRENTLLSDIKDILEVSQPILADKIGVNIKKYRLLERNVINPDAELLMRIYQETGCRPGLWLDFNRADYLIISDLWQMMTSQAKEEVLFLMEQGMSVLST